MGRQHAVVIGASIAGMCAARVLSDHYAKVTVFERDEPSRRPANRSAIPQGKHVHLLMARGAAEFEGLFPGVLDDMVSAGVPILENRPDCISFGAAGHLLGTQAIAARRVHRLRAESTASRMADQAPGAGNPERRAGAPGHRRTAIRSGRGTCDGCTAGDR